VGRSFFDTQTFFSQYEKKANSKGREWRVEREEREWREREKSELSKERSGFQKVYHKTLTRSNKKDKG
jgi:hypothetical protein